MKTGFLGLGAMGAPMARNLAKAGLLQGVWNRSHEKSQALAAELGCVAPTDPASLAAECDVLVLCVSADRDVLDVLSALESGLKPGTLVIDCSTVSAATARAAAEKMALHGARLLDCPVSGGVEWAKNGTLALMCGGYPTDFENASPNPDTKGRTVRPFATQGDGQHTTATNQ